MPFGGEPVGFGAFVLVKFAGYTAAGHLLRKAYDSPANAWKVGAVRTAIGVAAGSAYFAAWLHLKIDVSPAVWFLGLCPIRVLEWGLLLRIFFEPRLLRTARSWEYTVYGIVWSFMLDAIGVAAAFVVPGGVWVC